MTQDEIILAQQARIEQLIGTLEYLQCHVNHGGALWRRIRDELSTTDDLSALRAHDAALTAKHIEICKKLAAENEGLAGEVWCERCAEAIEKGGVCDEA